MSTGLCSLWGFRGEFISLPSPASKVHFLPRWGPLGILRVHSIFWSFSLWDLCFCHHIPFSNPDTSSYKTQPDNLASSTHPRVLNLTTPAKSLLPRKVTYSRVPGLGCGCLWRGYSVYHTPCNSTSLFLPYSLLFLMWAVNSPVAQRCCPNTVLKKLEQTCAWLPQKPCPDSPRKCNMAQIRIQNGPSRFPIVSPLCSPLDPQSSLSELSSVSTKKLSESSVLRL